MQRKILHSQKSFPQVQIWTLNYYFRHPHAGDDVALVVELIGDHSIELRTNITRNHYGLLFSLEDAKHVRLTEQIGSPALMWHHIALIFSSGSARLLVDGINVFSSHRGKYHRERH